VPAGLLLLHSGLPDGLGLCRRADSGKLQRVRRADGAGAEHDFAIGERFLFDLLIVESVGDPESTPALQEDAGDERTRHHGEIRSPPCRVEVAVDDAEAPSTPLRHGYEADSLVVLGVEIVSQGDAGGPRQDDRNV